VCQLWRSGVVTAKRHAARRRVYFGAHIITRMRYMLDFAKCINEAGCETVCAVRPAGCEVICAAMLQAVFLYLIL
jgi:hypothetical protein